MNIVDFGAVEPSDVYDDPDEEVIADQFYDADEVAWEIARDERGWDD